MYEEGRRSFYEHEVYKLVELVGAIQPPKYVFVPKGGMITPEVLAQYPGETVVLKIVSPQITHKTEAAGVVFVPKDFVAVKREIERMVTAHGANVEVEGVLVVEFVERRQVVGHELFVGVRATREFGPVIAAGLGGVDTEYLASKMRRGSPSPKPAMDITAEEFLELFKHTAAYDVLGPAGTDGLSPMANCSAVSGPLSRSHGISASIAESRGRTSPNSRSTRSRSASSAWFRSTAADVWRRRPRLARPGRSRRCGGCSSRGRQPCWASPAHP